MTRYCVLHGRNVTPGSAGCKYEIFDIVEFKNSKDLEDDMRQYVIERYVEKGKSEEYIEEDLFCRRRNIVLYDGRILAEKTKVFDNSVSNEYFCFVPVESFNK